MNSDPIFAILSRAIDISAMKQSAHAANVANADVAGYRRLEVTFDGALDAALAGQDVATAGVQAHGADERSLAAAASAEQGTPRLVTSTTDGVRLDQEMAQMAQNSVRYQALLTAFEKTMSLLRLAAREGREG